MRDRMEGSHIESAIAMFDQFLQYLVVWKAHLDGIEWMSDQQLGPAGGMISTSD